MLSWGPNGNCCKKSSAILGWNAVGEVLKDIIQEKDELDIFWLISYPSRWHLKIKKTQKMQRTAICATSHCSRTKVNTTTFQQVHTEGNFILYYNIQYRLRKMVPVVCHNLEHFDAHLIKKGLGKIQDHKINVIANTMEQYISRSPWRNNITNLKYPFNRLISSNLCIHLSKSWRLIYEWKISRF